MGSYGEEVQRAYILQKGTVAWKESRIAIAEFWKTLERTILSLDLDCSRLRIYQDALPACGREADIVDDLAKAGGENYRILLELMKRGAVLEGTESLELLLREYELLKSGKDGDGPSAEQETREDGHKTAADLLRERDCFIAGRIDETLNPGEIGLLFIGALHHVVELLPETIEVMTLEDLAAGLSRD